MTQRFIRMEGGGRTLVLPASQVRQIVPLVPLIDVPLARRHVAGVLPLEEKAIPVYRMADLELPAGSGSAPGRPAGSEAQIVILEAEGALAGFLVERVAVSGAPGDEGTTAITAPVLMAAASVAASPAQAGEGRAIQGE
ncbi:MAG TPA: chemotaxis protein CheW [Candidatus Polarisedimenticolia bacterium]|nr:chemotaxis protein CheW [Candidatus Polarisedimenticolia bacterium]